MEEKSIEPNKKVCSNVIPDIDKAGKFKVNSKYLGIETHSKYLDIEKFEIL